LINPWDVDGTKDAICRAVSMSPTETGRRMRALRRRVFEADVHYWARTFLGSLEMVTATDR
ncbi:MAG: trehalose-6-phosphate synthase, partial [Acidimicrobiales bacterium]